MKFFVKATLRSSTKIVEIDESIDISTDAIRAMEQHSSITVQQHAEQLAIMNELLRLHPDMLGAHLHEFSLAEN